MITPRVVDMFHGDILAHGDPVAAFKAMADAGIWGIIHKATQGIGVADPAYASRTKAAREAGLLTGAYHFNTGDKISSQVDHFFDVAQPDGQTLMALDFEDNRASQMTLANAVAFLQLADQKLGRPLWVYSGNRIKELIVNASDEVRQVFGQRHFWLCEYGAVARMVDVNGHPLPWSSYTLWQFSGDSVGPLPHTIPGMLTKGIDLNTYSGTREQIAEEWVS